MDDGLASLEALLPTTLGVFPQLRVTGRYVLGRHTRSHSGSGLKAVRLPDGRVAVAVAEAPGDGAVAAVTTARLLAVLYARLEDGADLEAALAAVDRYAGRTPFGPGATMAVAVTAQVDGTTQVGIAGHPTPVHLTARGETHDLLLSPSRPLGTGGTASTTDVRLGTGDSLLLHTNGLVTARDGLVADGARRLADVVAGLDPARRAEPDALVDAVLSAMQRPSGFVDDVALVVAQRCLPTAPFDYSGDLADGTPSACTAAMSPWLDGLGVSLIDHVTLQRAVAAISSTIVESHAESVPDAFAVHATLTDEGVVEVRVRDAAGWHPRTSTHEHGLVVAGGLVDSLHVVQDDGGTEVLLRQPVGRAVSLLRSMAQDPRTGLPLEPGADLPEMTSEETLEGLRVAGAVGTDDEDDFREALHRATCSATRSATVDLSGVARLPSHAVRSLFDYLDRAASSQVDLTVVAAKESVAHQVLTQAALPHVAY